MRKQQYGLYSLVPIHCDARLLHLQDHSINGDSEVDQEAILVTAPDLDVKVLVAVIAVRSEDICAGSRKSELNMVKCMKVEIAPGGTFAPTDSRDLD